MTLKRRFCFHGSLVQTILVRWVGHQWRITCMQTPKERQRQTLRPTWPSRDLRSEKRTLLEWIAASYRPHNEMCDDGSLLPKFPLPNNSVPDRGDSFRPRKGVDRCLPRRTQTRSQKSPDVSVPSQARNVPHSS